MPQADIGHRYQKNSSLGAFRMEFSVLGVQRTLKVCVQPRGPRQTTFCKGPHAPDLSFVTNKMRSISFIGCWKALMQ